MELLTNLFNQVLYYPLFNALIWLYNTIPGQDLGIAIIVLTVLIRLMLCPLSQKAIRSQKAMAKLQPKIIEIRKKYKSKEEQAKAMMELYKNYKINPFSGCLPILIQLPILVALYRVFFTGLDPQRLNGLYSFIEQPSLLNPMFLGLVDLSKRSVVLSLLAGIFMLIQSKMAAPQKALQSTQETKIAGLNISSLMSHQMVYFMPLMTIFIALSLPAALPLYWIVITLFGIVQQRFTKDEIGG